MRSEFRLPALGADMDEGTILEWHVAPGARVKRGDVVAVVETDKGAIDVEIFMDGVLREIVVQPGTKVPVGTVLALVDVEGEEDTHDLGIHTDLVTTADALFLAYDFAPKEITSFYGSDCDWPDWSLKYVMYGTLERAFGADTDGYIPSLRDYWKARKDIGIEALKRFKRMRLTDRDYRLGGAARKVPRGRGPSLPAGYPAI